MLKLESLFLIGHAHPALPGHFPEMPVVPGVVVLDQVLGVLATRATIDAARLDLPQVKFVQPLLPGQVARIELEVETQRARFRVSRDAATIATGSVQWQGPA